MKQNNQIIALEQKIERLQVQLDYLRKIEELKVQQAALNEKRETSSE